MAKLFGVLGCRIACLSTGHARAPWAARRLRLRARALGAQARCARGGGGPVGERGLRQTRKADDGGKLLRYRNSYRNHQRQRRALEVGKSPHLSGFRPRLAHRLHGWHRPKTLRVNPERAKSLAGLEGRKRSRCAAGSSTRSGPTEDHGPSVTVTDGSAPPVHPRRCAECPAAQQRAARGATANEPARKKTPGAKGAGRLIYQAASCFRVRRPWSQHLRPSASAARPRPLALFERTSVMRCTAPRSSSFSTAAISRAMRSSASS